VKPVMAAAAASTEAREEELVAGAQAGSIEAFEALFRRYRDRIASFVRASVRDEGRTEDLVQEIFFSAHNSLATLEHPSAFRAWLYQIARNACLDEARRKSRQDELILGWEEFPPPDERIVIHHQDADRMLSQKEELSHLTQALDGLPQSQHEALVLRELEGMSYDEIGRRMRLSRHAVESVLFRARRGLRGEYSEIQTGRRCRRMQALMAQIAEGMGDLRERRKLLRHMRDCSPCRREAAALGLSGLAVPSDERRGLERAFSRVAGFLPLPAFFSRRAGETDPLAGAGASSFATHAQTAVIQFSAVGTDSVVSAVHKAAAVVAAVAVVSGGGVAMKKAGVELPMKIPVLESIAAKEPRPKSDGNGSGNGKLPPDPKTEVKRAEAAAESPPAGTPAPPPAPSSAAATAPPVAPSTDSALPADPPADSAPPAPEATESVPSSDSQSFTSDGGAETPTEVPEAVAEPVPPADPVPAPEPPVEPAPELPPEEPAPELPAG
jgi:RNA polymerase sigma factor (sigma-70 family)